MTFIWKWIFLNMFWLLPIFSDTKQTSYQKNVIFFVSLLYSVSFSIVDVPLVKDIFFWNINSESLFWESLASPLVILWKGLRAAEPWLVDAKFPLFLYCTLFKRTVGKFYLIMESDRLDKNVTSVFNLMTKGQEEEDMDEYLFMEEVKTLTTFKIATVLVNYWFPLLVPIGFVGNTLSFIVMIKPNNRNVSTCIYMAIISINDNLMMYLCIHVFLVFVPKTHKWHPIECSIIGFLVLYALQNSTFQIIAMTLDKYIAIKWPHRAASYSTPRRATLIAVG